MDMSTLGMSPNFNGKPYGGVGGASSIFKSDPFRSALGGAAGGLFNLFGQESMSNPADEANKYFQQIPGAISPYYQPYIQQGQQAGQQLNQQNSQLTNDPGGLFNKFGQGFHQSPGYQFALQQGLNGSNSAAAAGGLLGTNAHQQQNTGVAEGLANQDYYNYMGNVLGLYGQGLTGLNNQYQTGYNASNELGQSIGNVLGAQGNAAYAGQANQNQSKGGAFGDLGSSIGQLLPFALQAFGL